MLIDPVGEHRADSDSQQIQHRNGQPQLGSNAQDQGQHREPDGKDQF